MPLSRNFRNNDDRTHALSQEHEKLVLHPRYIDDVALWNAFRAGDEKALVTIFDRFSDPMFNYGVRITADRELVKDCIQDLFIEIWKSRERLGDTDSIKYYLFKSLRRKLVRAQTTGITRMQRSLSDDYDRETAPSPESIIISEQVSAERRERLRAILDTLSKRQQEVMFLRYFEELNCEQIAQVMHLSKQAVYNLINRSLARLRASDE